MTELLAGLNTSADPGTHYSFDGLYRGRLRISRTTHNRRSAAFFVDLRRRVVLTAGDLEETMYL